MPPLSEVKSGPGLHPNIGEHTPGLHGFLWLEYLCSRLNGEHRNAEEITPP